MYADPYSRRKGKYRRARRTGDFVTILLLLVAAALLAAVGKMLVCDVWDSIRYSVIDTAAPRISGAADITVHVGDAVRYLDGVSAQDDQDRAPKLTVDSSQVDLTKPGNYPVTYTATDASGNTVSQSVTVTVLEAEERLPQDQIINNAADELLGIMLEDGMTTKEQVTAIYNWARESLHYGGHTDRTDWRQAAYTMLTEKRGDCYGYFAVTKLLFERLGIPNIDVQKVKNSDSDSDHFWSLVSVDGGVTYYHFDATPRVGDGDDFCLVTDEFLDDYSAAHKNSHNRDKSLYPATPEEALR